MQILLVAFLGCAGLLWLSVFGYLLALACIPRRRDSRGCAEPEWPPIAVVVPTRNEEALIAAKLENLSGSDYPAACMRVVVVDGASGDRTVEGVRGAIAAGQAVELCVLAAPLGRAEQLNYALRAVTEEIVVVTDADARLAPSCLRELVRLLLDDPETGVVGAWVRPASELVEERLHWSLQNWLWWLEGEALSAAGISGVCYAFRRETIGEFPADADAHDIHLALGAAARGYRARLAPAAEAVEVRVPQTARQFLQFRRRRGREYLRELRRGSGGPAPLGCRVARAMRLFHLTAAPRLAAVMIGAAALLAATPLWPWPFVAFTAFAAPAALTLQAAPAAACGHVWWRLGLAASRLFALTWLALWTVARPPSASAGTRAR